MGAARAAYRSILNAFGTGAGIAIGLIAAGVSVEVIIRNLGVGTLPWLTEIVEYAMFVATFLAAPWVLAEGGHVRVDLLLAQVPPPVRRGIEYLVDTIGLIVCTALVYYGFNAALDSWRDNIVLYNQWAVPEWWLLMVVPLSCLLMAVEFAARIARAYNGHIEKSFQLDGL